MEGLRGYLINRHTWLHWVVFVVTNDFLIHQQRRTGGSLTQDEFSLKMSLFCLSYWDTLVLHISHAPATITVIPLYDEPGHSVLFSCEIYFVCGIIHCIFQFKGKIIPMLLPPFIVI